MSRNYKKEALWKTQKYDEIRAYINKDLGEKLRKKLKEENKSIASWISDNAHEFIKKN